jgi:hypothetical protein
MVMILYTVTEAGPSAFANIHEVSSPIPCLLWKTGSRIEPSCSSTIHTRQPTFFSFVSYNGLLLTAFIVELLLRLRRMLVLLPRRGLLLLPVSQLFSSSSPSPLRQALRIAGV